MREASSRLCRTLNVIPVPLNMTPKMTHAISELYPCARSKFLMCTVCSAIDLETITDVLNICLYKRKSQASYVQIVHMGDA